MNDATTLRIGTRGSPLALAQAHEVRDLLKATHPELSGENAIEIVVIKTTGDAILDRPLAEIGGKGLFTREIDDAMVADDIDVAVHSMKDVPTWLPDGIILPCMLKREDPRDALISNSGLGLDDLAPGSVIGTASLRRQAQILARRSDVKVVSFRGNVQTRLRKLGEGQADATLLALAGLRRLGKEEVATCVLETTEILPAVGQGAIGITCRSDDAVSQRRLDALNDPDTLTCVSAERAFLAALEGSCRTPIAAYATLGPNGALNLKGLISRPDGTGMVSVERDGKAVNAEAIGRDAGDEARDRAEPGVIPNEA